MNVLIISRRTITDGEVVTFATEFAPLRHRYNASDRHEARGPFELVASRNGIHMIRAHCRTEPELDALTLALLHARRVHAALASDDGSGRPLMYSEEPVPVPK